jgi:hypothetical protein
MNEKSSDSSNRIKKPIFIIGTGRCGSTIFHSLFSRHPQLAWISGFCNNLHQWPLLNRLVLWADSNSLPQKILRHYLRPSEAVSYWEYLAPGFTKATQDLTAIDVHKNMKNRLRIILEKTITKQRNRLLHKFTGWPRIGYLLDIFPDAKFVHLYRDGRAVSNSFFEVDWWHGWQGPQNWVWGPLPDIYQREWEESNQAFIVLAAIQWKILMDSYGKAVKLCPEDKIIELKYEEIMKNPVRCFEQVLEHCELEKSEIFLKFVSEYPFKSANYKWKTNLSDKQQGLLQESLASHLEKYGYI